MKVTGTKEAFKEMLKERGVYNKLGVDRSTVAHWKKYVDEDKITLDLMEKYLITYGATVVKEKTWELPGK